MMKQTNPHLPEEEQIARSMWSWSRTGFKSGDQLRLWRMHRRFFPDSLLRFCWATIFALTLGWMFLGLSLLYH
jgi:hypothetical protein